MLSEEIGNKLDGILQKYQEVNNFIEEVSRLTDIIFFGGSIRDLYLDKSNFKIKDLDIVLTNEENKDYIEQLIYKYEYKTNRFGGYKVIISGQKLDIWFLENTWAFRNKKLEASEDNLTRSVYLSTDGISYNYNKKILDDDIFSEANEKKIIDIILNPNPYEELNLTRALVFKKKYNYSFSNELLDRFNDYMSKDHNFTKKLYEIQLKHYKEEILTYSEIDLELS